ncbi:glycerate kinase [Alkalihalobacillus sp. R86527]|uniref:glycerate kinase n=1 Tax=Alkalihalobacillus sp. R86527 TaxID=3093863 RepID=UPI00367262D7
MNILIAPDSYKGSLTALEVGTTMKEAFEKEMPEATVDVIPMADGGEGTLRTLTFATNGKQIPIEVTGPLGTPITSEYGVLGDGKTVVIEVANIAGLPLVPTSKRDPLNTTSFGIGEAILQAIDDGFKDFIIGLGGSATNDGGLGMLQALGVTFHDSEGQAVSPYGSDVERVQKVDFTTIHPSVNECHFKIASDVDNPLCGELGASAIFGPQKGATEEKITTLDKALKHYADVIEDHLCESYQHKEGSGAAGGLGFAFLLLKGDLMSGSEIVAKTTGLIDKIRQADWVITGEGQSDYQTLYGKVPAFIAKSASENGVRTILLSGSLGKGYEQLYDYFTSCFSITAGPISLDDCIENAQTLLFNQTRNIARLLKPNH